jgi:ABC-type uncharacterized transport system substrate-binding protein
VQSLNRPGGNMTGVSLINVELMPKRVEMLHELIPQTETFAVLVNPKNPSTADTPQSTQAMPFAGSAVTPKYSLPAPKAILSEYSNTWQVRTLWGC